MKQDAATGGPTGRSRWRTSTLVRRALEARNEDAYWSCVGVLHERGTREVLDAATELLSSALVKQRALGADVLAQVGGPERRFSVEPRDLLYQLLRDEVSEEVIASALHALAHAQDRDDPTGIESVVRLADHPSPEVRDGLVMALLCHAEQPAIRALVELSRAPESHIRDWATFGLGTQIDLDTPQIRAALRERLQDDDANTRAEALVGLARRRDPGVVEHLCRELSRESPGTLIFEAAAECGDRRLLALLEDHAERCRDDPDVSEDWFRCLEETISALEGESS